MSRDQLYLQANQAGQAARSPPCRRSPASAHRPLRRGEPGRVLLAGHVFGGIEVCIQPRRHAEPHDFNSGCNASPTGYCKGARSTCTGAQALAFVRQRDTLPDGDLGRTHRQQAVLDYVIWKLKHQNLVANLLEGNALLNDLKTFMITSGGWNIVEFATEMRT